MDTMITSEPSSSGSAVTETAPEQTGAAGSGAETGAESGSQSDAGGEQSSTEGGQQEVRSGRKWSVYDEIKELRAQRREWRDSQSSWQQERQQMMEELRAIREAQQNRPGPDEAGLDPQGYWKNPAEWTKKELQALRDELRSSIVEEFHNVRQTDAAQSQIDQERTGAVEFIRSQKGYDPQDDEDLIEIIHGIPNRQHLSPQMVAEYAWMKFQQSRGVGDRTNLKQRASSAIGQPPGAGLGRKQYSQAEFEAAVNQAEEMFRRDPNDPKINDFLTELHSAQRDGRVK